MLFDLTSINTKHASSFLGNSLNVMVSALVARDLGLIGSTFTAEELKDVLRELKLGKHIFLDGHVIPNSVQYAKRSIRSLAYNRVFEQALSKALNKVNDSEKLFNMANKLYEEMGCFDDYWDDIDKVILDVALANCSIYDHYRYYHLRKGRLTMTRKEMAALKKKVIVRSKAVTSLLDLKNRMKDR